MGASSFREFHKADDLTPATRKRVFERAVKEAQYEYGHGGYTGTIAEKHDCRFIGGFDTLKEANEHADDLIEKDDPRISDKWGPAGAIEVRNDPKHGKGFVFFGWASS
jgi:hypothetical protein